MFWFGSGGCEEADWWWEGGCGVGGRGEGGEGCVVQALEDEGYGGYGWDFRELVVAALVGLRRRREGTYVCGYILGGCAIGAERRSVSGG